MLVAAFAAGLLNAFAAEEGPATATQEPPPTGSTNKDASTPDAEGAAPKPDQGDGPDKKKEDKELTRAGELIETIKKGKTVGYVLIVVSVFGLAFALERLFRLRRGAIVPRRVATQADELWRSQKFDDIRKLCQRRRSTLGRIIVAMVEHRDAERGDIRSLAEDIGSRELRSHLQRAYPLAVVATLSPLLGLLGTVFGMIACFDKVAVAGELGNPSMLADGISQALVTTAMGLVIAVPALALYHYFRNRTTQYALALDEEVSELIRRWFLAN
jgi:biopolymer transport protein ExbB